MSSPHQRREKILAEMAQIERMERGKLTAEYRERAREGQTVVLGPYYKYQCWQDGRNVSRRVPAEEAEALQEAVDGYHHFRDLADEYAELTIQITRERTDRSRAKKKPR